MALINCIECGHVVSSAAAACPQCGAPIAPPARTWNRGIAALLSLIIPGAGHMYKNKPGVGFAWLIATVIGYLFYVLPGMLLHVICIIHAMSDREGDAIERMAIREQEMRRLEEKRLAKEAKEKRLPFVKGRV